MKNKAIIALLQSAYAAELETVANYLANSVWLDGLRAEEVKESLDEDIAEELGHAKQLAQRIKQLGGRPPGSLSLARGQKSLQPPKDSTDLYSVIQGVIDAEEADQGLRRHGLRDAGPRGRAARRRGGAPVPVRRIPEEHRAQVRTALARMRGRDPRPISPGRPRP